MFAPLGFLPGVTPEQIAAIGQRGGWYEAGVPTVEHYMKMGAWFAGPPEELVAYLRELESRYPGLEHINLSTPDRHAAGGDAGAIQVDRSGGVSGVSRSGSGGFQVTRLLFIFTTMRRRGHADSFSVRRTVTRPEARNEIARCALHQEAQLRHRAFHHCPGPVDHQLAGRRGAGG